MKVLVDTSVWVDHMRTTLPDLVALLQENAVIGHSFVIGELACGNLRHRREILSLLQHLPAAVEASASEAIHLLETETIFGKGIGWVDACLLASCRLSSAVLWTNDKRLEKVAKTLELSY